MDDKQGNVIDGTARARNWRRRSKTRPDDEAEAARSDAPKSIASSLLVPVDMLSGERPPGPEVPPDETLEGAAGPARPAGPAGRLSEESEHQNPFLAPNVALQATGERKRRGPSEWARALSGWLIGVPTRAVGLLAPLTVRRASGSRRSHATRLRRSIAVAISAAAVIALGVDLLAQAPASTAPSPHRADSSANEFTPAMLFAVRDPLRGPAKVLAGVAHRRDVRGASERTKRSKSHTSSGTTVVAYHYTPAATSGAASTGNAAASTSSQAASPAGEPSASSSAPVSQPAAVQQAPGPAGPAYVIGSNCNPKCR